MPEQLQWTTVRRRVRDLIPYEHNPRRLTEKQAQDLRASLERFNLVEIPVIDTTNRIMAGHQRLKVMAMLGRADEEIDVRYPSRALTEDEFREYLVRSNKNTGEWDMEALANNFEVHELLDWGFTEDELEIAPVEASGGDDQAEEPEPGESPTVSQPGDIFEFRSLGFNLRIMCGDSQNIEHVNKLVAGMSMQCIWTDPPWNVNYGADMEQGNAQGYRPRRIQNDSMSQEQFHGFLKSVFANMCAVSDDGAMVYVAMSAQEWGTIMQAMKECAFHWSSTIIWAKDRLVLSRKDYHTRYEPIWYGWKEGSRLMPLTDRTQDDVWEIPRPSRSDEHPTMKPVELIVKSLQNSSRIGCNVLDLFNGSGSTAIACAKTGRNYYGMEIDPHYLDASLKRIRKWLSGRSVEFVMNRNGQAFEWPEEEAAAGEGGTV